jgi:potassium efflux system protein
MNQKPIKQRPARLVIYGWIAITLLFTLPASGAKNSDADLIQTEHRALEQLEQQKKEQLRTLKDSEITEELLDLTKLELESAKVRQQSILVELQDTTRTLQQLKLEPPSEKKRLTQQDKVESSATELTNALAKNTQQINEYKEKVNTLKALQSFSHERIQILSNWRENLQQRYQDYQAQSSEDKWILRQKRLEKNKSRFLEKAASLKQVLANTDPDSAAHKHRKLQTDIFLAEQNAELIELDFQLHKIEKKLRNLNLLPVNKTHSTEEVIDTQRRSKTLLSQLGALDALFGRKLQLVNVFISQAKSAQGGVKNPTIKRLKTLQKVFIDWQIKIRKLIDDSRTIIDQSQLRLKTLERLELSTRNRLPDSVADWHQVVVDLSETIPQEMILSSSKLYQQSAKTWKPIATIFFIILWLGLMKYLSVIFKKYLHPINKNESAFSSWFINILARLIRSRLLMIALLGSFLLFALINKISFQQYAVYFYLSAVFLILQTALKLNRLLYDQRHFGMEWYDRSLFLGLKWSSILAAILVALTLLVHHYAVAQITQDTIDRLIMLGLLTVSVLLLWRRRNFLSFFKENLQHQPRLYFFLAILSLLLPLAGLLTALIGFAGYTNLAWKMGKYEGFFLLAFFSWLIARGYVIDTFEWAARRATTYQPNGWIWAKAIIYPLLIVARIVLIVLAFLFLFWLIQINGNTSLISQLQTVGKHSLFEIGKTEITSFKILAASAVIIVFVWAARWSKEIAYRWLFKHIVDHGARNSLSVFTQYSVVIIGIFALLKALGIDLTALAVLAGAIGVGIGFGLQTIANNFISGVLLLIERPFRTGDIVNIGNNEGMVTHIGIRSLTVKTWDNMEVIIPNTDTMTSPFTNWTHQDTNVRTTLRVGVAYKEDPHTIIRYIKEILDDHDAILSTPRSEVFLDEFADSSINLRIQYYIDVSKHNRLNIKSEVLLAIWDRFKQDNIEIPYPQSDIHIKDSVSTNTY